MEYYSNPIEMIGKTPLLKLNKFDTGPCELFVKLEDRNPSGSIKDRIALKMIEVAEQEGQLKPGGTIIEATAGNTGLGLALIAAIKGYSLILVMPDKMSKEKIAHARALGAEVLITRSDVNKGHPEYYQDYAQRLAKETDNAFYVNQFGNENNPLAHELTTGPEIWEQMDHNVDAIVCGVGSSGTLTGIGRFMKKTAPHVEMILADPKGSILANYIKMGKIGEAASWLVEGIGEDFIPSIADLSLASDAFTVTDQQAFETTRALLRKEGILAGSSVGTLLHAALQYCQQQTKPKRVVTFICDTGNKYLSKMYDDVWMRNQGFLETPAANNLSDFISYPYAKKTTVVISPKETLLTAYKRLQQNNISQLPVLENDKLVGLLGENELLRALEQNPNNFNAGAEDFMDTKPSTIDVNASKNELLALFTKNPAVCIMDKNNFLGITTKLDLIHAHYRSQN